MVHYIGIKLGEGIESSIALLNDQGVLEKVLVEERFNRKKYSGCIPMNGIYNIFKYLGEDDEVRASKHFNNRYSACEKLFKNFSYVDTQPLLHHLCHAYESFYTSGFKSAAILVIDGFGNNSAFNIEEKECITLYHKIGKETHELKKYFLPNSIGYYYEIARNTCGFKANEEGHFMGLSAYGKPFEKKIFGIENGEFKHYEDISVIGNKYSADKNSLKIINSINFAATIQRDVNEAVLELVKDIKKMTNEDNLCISGGVFNNVITNNLICESGIFKNVWCSPAPGDFGLSIGEAYITYEQDAKELSFYRMSDAYKGSGEEYNSEYIIEKIKEVGYDCVEIDKDLIIKYLTEGNVLAWYQGSSEFGRRALGHRSLLADPECDNIYDKLSYRIKGRAPYRPLACTVPEELFDLMFDVKNKDLTEYMLRAIPIKNEMQDKVFGCTAIDGTTRPQCLKREKNPELYDLIMNFYKITQVPCVINTSLNGGGEPIIETPEDLISFLRNNKEVKGAVINGKYWCEIA